MPNKAVLVERGKPSYRTPHRLVEPEEQEHQGIEPDGGRPVAKSAFKQGQSDAR